MGMQAVLKFLNFLVANKVILLNLAGLAAVYAVLQLWAWLVYGPKDTVGNGITIGQAKAFDNRSLQLRIERLSASLANLKVVNQNVTENLATLQRQTTSKSSRSLTLEAKATPGTAGDNESAAATGNGKGGATKATESDEETQSETKPAVALAASDVLSDQLNLASQILNLETLYERSLTDRLLGEKTRLQTVLGFQVSITPPRGCENSVAVAEVAVRMPDDKPISLVALIPQEKTYNAQTVSTSAQSIGGSAVASVLTLGFTSKGESRQLFIHRDSDTIAFERDARSQPTLFENDSAATVFGWEFRPVLGRSSVTAGTRQMLAVIAVPTEELETESEISLQIQTRSYWRHFNRRTQTTSGKWSWLPWRVDRSRKIDSEVQDLIIPNTARIQGALAPRVKEIKWVNSGADRATVIVKGWNFFSGTKVVIGGKTYREEDGSLTLKSHQALEFETTIAALATGDCVLSGRFGSSTQFIVETEKRIASLGIDQAEIAPGSSTKEVYIKVDIKGLDADGLEVDLVVKDIQKLPEPILFVGTEAIRMPYDYFDLPEPAPADGKDARAKGEGSTDSQAKEVRGTTKVLAEGESPITEVAPANLKDELAKADSPAGATETGAKKDGSDAANQDGEKKYIRVGAWIPKSLATSSSVAFRVPFCGFGYHTSYPLTYSEPSVTLMGNDGDYSVFRIASPLGFLKPFSVELDKKYKEGCPELRKTSSTDWRFRVPTKTVTKYQQLVLRSGSAGPHVLPISVEAKPEPETTIVTTGKPPQIKTGGIGPVEWSGTELNKVSGVTLITAGAKSPITLEFHAYDSGKKIEVYFTEESTATVGKAEVKFQIEGGEPKKATLFITKGTPES
jgi:hypothetical protein